MKRRILYARELTISEIIPVHNANVLIRILKKTREKEKERLKMGRIRGLFWKFVSLLSGRMMRWDNTLFPENT